MKNLHSHVMGMVLCTGVFLLSAAGCSMWWWCFDLRGGSSTAAAADPQGEGSPEPLHQQRSRSALTSHHHLPGISVITRP